MSGENLLIYLFFQLLKKIKEYLCIRWRKRKKKIKKSACLSLAIKFNIKIRKKEEINLLQNLFQNKSILFRKYEQDEVKSKIIKINK